MDQFNEKCPRCDLNDWELSDKHNNCYCRHCHGYFRKEDVKKYWEEGQKQPTLHEEYANMKYITRKPKPIHDPSGQFPWRCPICRTKSMYRNDALRCIDTCWKKVKEIRKNKAV